MNIIYTKDKNKLIHGDNLDVMQLINENEIDSCISDFPYFIEFMNKKWDSKIEIYKWCYPRAIELFRIMKNGGYVCIFGHHKTNHRMKCAFEDAGFNIVEEIDWIQLTGFPKNQDIGKMFDRAEGLDREIISVDTTKQRPNASINRSKENAVGKFGIKGDGGVVTEPQSELAKQFNGFKTSGLKPLKEIITIFQKPLIGTYIQNIKQYGCGAMNIDACRVPMSKDDEKIINAKSSKNPTQNYSSKDDKIFGAYDKDMSMPANSKGRFPPNVFFDEAMAHELDLQTGITKSSGGQINSCFRKNSAIYNTGTDKKESIDGGYGDVGGGSRLFPMFKYEPKTSKKERMLHNGTRNPHVTVKPKNLIKWLIKLVTPLNGITIDITAGSCTHAVSCEELNRYEDYNLTWFNIELMNTEDEPYCNIGKQRLEDLNETI